MTPSKKITVGEKSSADKLRLQAEAKLKKKGKAPALATTADALRLVHELKVHQIELEMQNEELLNSRAKTEELVSQYADLYDFAPVGYFTLERNGAIVQVNLAGAILLGIERGKLIKRRFGLFVAEPLRATFNAFLDKVFSNQTKETCEVELLKDGATSLWTHIEAAADNERGEACRIVIVDITERRRAEEALRESESHFKIIFNESPMGVALIDSLTGFLYNVNPMFAKIAGRTMEQMQNIDWMSITHPDDVQADLDNMAALNAGKINGFQMEKRYLRPDGTVIWINMTIAPLKVQDKARPRHLCMIEDITERKQAEEKIATANNQIQVILASINNAFFSLDNELVVTYFNPAAEKALGKPKEEVVGRNLFDVFVEARGSIFEEKYRRAIKEKIQLSFETYFGVAPYENWYDVNVYPHTEGISVYFQVVTEYKRTENALRESEYFFKESQRAASIGSYKTDFVAGHWESSEVLDQIFGIDDSYDRSIQGWLEIVHPDEREALNQYLTEEVITKRNLFNREYRIIRKSDGTTRWVSGLGEVKFNADGAIVSMIGTIQDITERKRTEEKIQESEARYRVVIQSATDAIVSADGAGNVASWNASAERVFGYSETEILGQALTRLMPERYREKHLEGMERVWSGGETRIIGKTVEVEGLRKDGSEFPLELSISIWQIADEKFCTAIIRDVTERKQAEEALRENEERLRSIFAAMSEGFSIQEVICDDKGKPCDLRFVDANPAFEIQTGLKNADTLGHTLLELFPQSEPYWIERYGHVGLTGEPTHFDAMFGPLNIHYQVSAFQIAFGRFGVMFMDISERKRMEEVLRDSEEKLNKAQRYAHVGSWTWNVKTNQLQWSDEMYRIFGIDKKSFTGDLSAVVARAIHPDDRAKVEESNRSVADDGKPIPLEYRVVWADGTIRVVWAEAGELLLDEQGNPSQLSGIVQDITERKRAEEKMNASETRYRRLFEASKDGILILDAETGMIMDVNPFLIEMLGYSHVEFLGKKVWELGFLRDVIANQDNFLELQQNEYIRYEDKPLETAFGKKVRVEFISNVYLVNNKKVIQCNIRDITERKLAEEKVWTQTVALEAAANGVVITDKDGRIEWFNSAWSALTGYSSAEVVGKNPRILKSGIQDKAFYKNLWDTILAGQVWRGELVNRRKDGTLYHEEETITPVLNERGEIKNFIAIKQDISARKRAEQITQARLRLNSYALIFDTSEFLQKALDEAEALTESNIGFFHFVEKDQTNIKLQAWSTNTLSNMCNAEGEGQHYPVDTAGIWAETIRDQEPHIYNDYPTAPNRRGMPEGHAVVTRFLTVPLIQAGKVAAVLGVGNKTQDYSQADFEILAQLVSDAWDMVLRKIAEDALARSNQNLKDLAEDLESRVKKRTAEIETTRQRLELAVTAGEIGVWEANVKEDKILWDKRMHLFHGVNPEYFDGSLSAWWRTIHPQDLAQLQAQFQDALDKTGAFSSEYRILRPDGSLRHVTANAIVLYDAEHQPERIVGVNLDVTERKQIEEAMLRANVEMRRALRVKDEFLANMSHELRTPLNAVTGISESLLEQTVGALNEKQKKYVSTIRESGEHLLDLINDILDLSKIEAGRMDLAVADVSIQLLWDSSFRMVKEMAAKKNIAIAFEADERAQTVRGDQRRLLQILVNLLSNAIKFTPAGGQAGVKIVAHPAANQITFTVWDTGIGIAKDDIPRLFQSFTQLDSGLSRESSGTGLGLALVMQMARLHGGNVSVESVINEGSRFTVALPWDEAAQNQSPKINSQKTVPLAALEKRRAGVILLMEDTESVIMLVRDYLEARGYQVLVAHDGLLGVETAKRERPDLILLDIQMPGMDGFESVEQLRADKALKAVPIIALTALAMPGDKERCLAAGMNDYMSKPIRLGELMEMVGRYISIDN